MKGPQHYTTAAPDLMAALQASLTRAREAREARHPDWVKTCSDPVGHTRLYAQSERTWRLSAAQRRGEAEIGCAWCGLPSGHVRGAA